MISGWFPSAIWESLFVHHRAFRSAEWGFWSHSCDIVSLQFLSCLFSWLPIIFLSVFHANTTLHKEITYNSFMCLCLLLDKDVQHWGWRAHFWLNRLCKGLWLLLMSISPEDRITASSGVHFQQFCGISQGWSLGQGFEHVEVLVVWGLWEWVWVGRTTEWCKDSTGASLLLLVSVSICGRFGH